MRYLITTNLLLSGQRPFFTNWFNVEKDFNSEIEMVVYDLHYNKYTEDGINWYEIEFDHL